jgi:endo-1,3-1,4-beta-glycanase ExoK
MKIKRIIVSFIISATLAQVALAVPLVSYSWSDMFDSLHTRWSLGDWSFKATDSEFSPENVKVEKGVARLAISKKDGDIGKYPDKNYFGSQLFTSEKQLYGKYKVLLKPNSPKGVITSFYLLNADYDEKGALVDWSEIDLDFPGTTKKVQLNVRWKEEGVAGLQDIVEVVDLDFDASLDYHEFIIEWAPKYIVFYADGKLLHKIKDPKVLKEFNKPQSLRMNYWIENVPGWAGEFEELAGPIESLYKNLRVYSIKENPFSDSHASLY